MNTELFEVGAYIDDEFFCFAVCTNITYADEAKKLLEHEQDFEEIVIRKSNLFLNSITIDEVIYDLTVDKEDLK